MARLPWPWWTALENGDAARLARGLRRIDEAGEPMPPGLLAALADMLDSPKGHVGAKLKMTRARGGRRATFDSIKIGRAAHDGIAAGRKIDSVVIEVAAQFGCDERTVRRHLAAYRIGIDPDNETPD